MPPIVIPNTVRIAIVWETGAVNVLHARNDFDAGPFDPSTLQTVLDDFAAAFATNVLVLLSDDGAVGEFRVKDISVANGDEVAAASTGAGSISGVQAPLNVAMVSTWRTGLNGRRGRGRTFWPHIPNSYIETGGKTFTSASTVAMQAGAQAMVDDFAVASVFNLAVASVADGVSRSIFTTTVDNKIDTIRGRVRD